MLILTPQLRKTKRKKLFRTGQISQMGLFRMLCREVVKTTRQTRAAKLSPKIDTVNIWSHAPLRHPQRYRSNKEKRGLKYETIGNNQHSSFVPLFGQYCFGTRTAGREGKGAATQAGATETAGSPKATGASKTATTTEAAATAETRAAEATTGKATGTTETAAGAAKTTAATKTATTIETATGTAKTRDTAKTAASQESARSSGATATDATNTTATGTTATSSAISG
jgi:hypothetical protein